MNKKKKNILLHAGLPFLALAAVVVGIYLWFFAPKDYRDLIPAESRAVVSLDAAAAQKLLSPVGLPADATAASLGLDSETTIYAFITPNEYYGQSSALIRTWHSPAAGRVAPNGLAAIQGTPHGLFPLQR